MILKDNFSTLLDKSKSNIINNKYTDYISKLSDDIVLMPNFILYGPPGTGKYTESLKIIEKYSPSYLKYERKLTVSSSKNEHVLKISDIHYEIDLENMTCNSKILFNDVYNNIIDAIQSSSAKTGIILCKNFHEINNEIIEFFYSYMQKSLINNITLRFILLTEHISFIPANIQDLCKTLYYSKLSYSNYMKLSNANNKKLLSSKQKMDANTDKLTAPFISNISSINLLKYLDINSESENMINHKRSICDKIIHIIISTNLKEPKISYNNIRNILYDLLINDLNFYDCTYYIIDAVIRKKIEMSGGNIDSGFITKILERVCLLFKYYNNNYRPIYHLEAFILYLIKLVNENDNKSSIE
tara:strand:- start:3048 stop:4121 length:1074 start_codon:yes stop_codon:yes gene_type:complete